MVHLVRIHKAARMRRTSSHGLRLLHSGVGLETEEEEETLSEIAKAESINA